MYFSFLSCLRQSSGLWVLDLTSGKKLISLAKDFFSLILHSFGKSFENELCWVYARHTRELEKHRIHLNYSRQKGISQKSLVACRPSDKAKELDLAVSQPEKTLNYILELPCPHLLLVQLRSITTSVLVLP